MKKAQTSDMADVCSHSQITVDHHAKATNTLERLQTDAGQGDLVIGELLTTTSGY